MWALQIATRMSYSNWLSKKLHSCKPSFFTIQISQCYVLILSSSLAKVKLGKTKIVFLWLFCIHASCCVACNIPIIANGTIDFLKFEKKIPLKWEERSKLLHAGLSERGKERNLFLSLWVCRNICLNDICPKRHFAEEYIFS